MIQFTYDLNPKPILDGLDSCAASIADPTPALASVADDFREMVAEQFSTEGSASGTPWAPLAASTLRRRHSGSNILDATGALLGSLADPGASGHVEAYDGPSLSLGSELPFASYLQTGTGIGFGQTEVPSAFNTSRRDAATGILKSSGGTRKATSGRKPKKGSGTATREKRAGAGPGRGRALPMRPILVLTDERGARWIEIVRQSVERKTLALGAGELA